MLAAPQTNVAKTSVHLRLEGVTKRFGALSAVDHISLEIPRGTFTTLLGPSGCGKTTLLRLVAGFYEPDEGNIYLADRLINSTPAHRRGTAMVFQDYALFPHMRVFDNVAYGLRLAHVPKAALERRVAETLEFVGLKGLDNRSPNELSGGQQQRVALARALVVQPEVLLLDEPLSNLDAKLRERMRWELRALQRRLNMTFVYVTHDQEEALAMSDWIAVLNNGQVEQWGAPWEIYYHPRTPFLADFVGAVNLLPATVLERQEDSVTVSLGEHCLRISTTSVPAAQQVLLCIRPESLTIKHAQSPLTQEPSRLHLSGTVMRQAFLGNLMRYWVRVGAQEWIVDQPDPSVAAFQLNGPVVLSVPTERVHLIAQSH